MIIETKEFKNANQERHGWFVMYYNLKTIVAERKTNMFRLWGKIWTENRLVRDIVIEEPSNDTRTHKVFHALDQICYAFDLSKPIWLDKTIQEFKRHDKARFNQDNFIDSIDFDYLEIHVIEED